MLMTMASMLAHVVDVKGAFLHEEFEDGKNHTHEGSAVL